MNDFKDNNICINIGEELIALKNEIKIDFETELETQIGGKVDYLFISHDWKDFIKCENLTIKTVSCY